MGKLKKDMQASMLATLAASSNQAQTKEDKAELGPSTSPRTIAGDGAMAEVEPQTGTIKSLKKAEVAMKALELRLTADDVIGVCVKGNLRRHGHVSSVVVSSGADEALIFDIGALSKKALKPLKRLLENPLRVKVMHDCRAASDALFHLHGIQLQSVFDTAVAWKLVHPDERQGSIKQLIGKYAPQVAAHLGREALELTMQRRTANLISNGRDAASTEIPRQEPSEAELTVEAKISKALVNAAMEMTPSLERWQSKFASRCEQQLSVFRDWPGQNIDALPLGQISRFEFSKDGSLCVLGESDVPKTDCLTLQQDTTDHAEDQLLAILPTEMRQAILQHVTSAGISLVELVLGVGRAPEVRSRSAMSTGIQADLVGEKQVSKEEIAAITIAAITSNIGKNKFNLQDRAGIEGTLHRISATRNQAGEIITLTMRIGRASRRLVQLLADVVADSKPVLFLGPPGVGKTTLLRACAEAVSQTRSTVVIDPAGEIAGCGDSVHPAVGRSWKDVAYSPKPIDRSEARRLAMGRALENMLPEVIVVDEIGTPGEAKAARTIAERGTQLVATAHGRTLRDLISNCELRDLIGGLRESTLGDDNPRYKASKRKSVTERASKPVFPTLVELRSSSCVVVHLDVAKAVDNILENAPAPVQIRTLDEQGRMFVEKREQ
ncbi:unnamed protein product [Polarella glacialis]|uniref:AAA+ ATPase domain-containing protein n=1 Tax=Polarella glacialis TaxID=89957 RepID=A0A813DUQ0_POLGL|nr:unnamed protein product [Polarella glacialis]